MTQLYLSNATPWRGERINGVLPPGNAAQLWSDAELAAIGLYRPQQPVTIPEGKQVSATVALVDGVVRFALEDIPPEPPIDAVSAAQAKLALDAAGLLDDVEAMIAAHPVRAVRIWFADANVWERSHPYVSALGLEMSLDDDAIDGLFAAASLY